MSEILGAIGDVIGGFFENPVVQLAIQFGTLYLVLVWLAAAFWAFRDMQQRTESPVLPYVAAAVIILFTPALFLLGVVVYRIVRPQERLAEVYERNLAEEALLAEVETIHACPGCRRRVDGDWIACPTCRTRLARVCAACSRLVGLDWVICAWCGKEFDRGDVAAREPISAAGLAELRRLDTPSSPPARAATAAPQARPIAPAAPQARPAAPAAPQARPAAPPLGPAVQAGPRDVTPGGLAQPPRSAGRTLLPGQQPEP